MVVEVPNIEKPNNQSLGIHCREEYQNVICKWKPYKIYKKVRPWAGELYVNGQESYVWMIWVKQKLRNLTTAAF